MLMGCDGIWETMSVTEMMKFIDRHMKQGLRNTNEKLLDHLIAEDNKGGVGCDNMSSILIDITKLKNKKG